MPARRRTSSSGRSPRPPSDGRDQQPPPPAQLTLDLSDVNPDVAVYRVRNFSTKSGSVVNRGDSIKVRRGHKAEPENGSVKTSRRASDSAQRSRRDVVSRQESRAGTEHGDSDGHSPSAVAASLLPDEQDDGRCPDDDAWKNGAEPSTAITRSKRNVDDTDVYKVLVLGSQGVGKTTLVEQLMTSEYLANKDNSFIGKWLPLFNLIKGDSVQ